jgi:hypothetical protein
VRKASEIPAKVSSSSERSRIASGADAGILSREGVVEKTIVAGDTV